MFQWRHLIATAACWIWLFPGLAMPDNIKEAPLNIQAAIFLKLLQFNRNISQGGDVTLYVIKADEFGKAMKVGIGNNIGKSVLAKIELLDQVPTEKPHGLAVLYIGDKSLARESLAYSGKYKILSITGDPKTFEAGASLIVGVSGKKPKVVLTQASSDKEGIQWDPQIHKIATVVPKSAD